MRVLGIDPGLANVGWAVIENKEEPRLLESGCITTKAKSKAEIRLGTIFEAIESLIEKFEINTVAIESIFFAKNAKSALRVAEAVGVIKVGGFRQGVEVVEYTPLQIKMALVGYGRADKSQVEKMVGHFLNLSESMKAGHSTDAMAAALTHLFQFSSIVKK